MLALLVIFAVITRCFGVEGVGECIGKCPQATENGLLNFLPHNDCNKFCVCVAGKLEEFLCKPDQHWSPELERCTHPAEAKCQNKILGLGCVSECPANDILIGHYVCSKYCECRNSRASVRNCLPGFYFSTLDQTCVEWEYSDCHHESIAQLPTNSPIAPPKADALGCIGQCPKCNSLDHTDHLPHTDEHKFCKCNWGKPVVFKCPDDLVYIEKDQVCGYPYGGCP